MNTSKWNVTSRAALLIAFTAGLIACGGPDVSGQDCEIPCLDSQGPGTNEQPLPCGDYSECSEEPPPDGGGGTTSNPCHPRTFLGKYFEQHESAMNLCYGHWLNRTASTVTYCPSASGAWSCPVSPLVFNIGDSGSIYAWAGTY